MVKKHLILLALTLATALESSAQELPLWLRYQMGKSLEGPMLLKSSDLLFDPNAPFQWEQEQEIKKYVLEIRREERARKAIEPVKKSFEKPNVKVVFKLRGGNTEGNWSPYPDRALDARVIRYPLPRSAAYGKPGKGAPRPAH